MLRMVLFFCALLFHGLLSAQSLRITNVMVYDGTGSKPYRGEVRVEGDQIVDVGKKLTRGKGEQVQDGRGMALAPGFIDMHSHADRGIFEQPHTAVIQQGITTVLVGQDGGSQFPLKDFFAKLDKQPAAMNVASMAGHGTLREQVLGKDILRKATPEEIEKMQTLLHYEMQAGAKGLSSGLEYDAGQFAETSELAKLAEMSAGHGGFYISHVRDEGNGVFKSFDEIIEIGSGGKSPVQITHIKLATTPVWHLAEKRMPQVFAEAEKRGVKLNADVYPYTYWQSSLRVIVLDRDYFNPAKVKKAIDENGGPERLRITEYKPDASLEGKTLAEIAQVWKTDVVEAFMRLVKSTQDIPDGDAGVIGESMHEDDVRWFIANPRIMFCTDGELRGPHPRGAGAFPRVLGRYVREQKVLPLEEAVRKMTLLPAMQLDLKDRGRISKSYKADLVIFDPKTVIDRSTIEKPHEPPAGIHHVMVNGKWVVQDGKVTDTKPGVALRQSPIPE